MTHDVSLTSRARVSDDVVFRELDGEAVLLDLESGTYYGLDAVGTRIWQLIAEHGMLAAVLDGVVSEFDVERDAASADLLELVRRLTDRGLLEIEP
jgi:hypothetical protein